MEYDTKKLITNPLSTFVCNRRSGNSFREFDVEGIDTNRYVSTQPRGENNSRGETLEDFQTNSPDSRNSLTKSRVRLNEISRNVCKEYAFELRNWGKNSLPYQKTNEYDSLPSSSPPSPPLLEKSFLRSAKTFVRFLIEFVPRIRVNIVPPPNDPEKYFHILDGYSHISWPRFSFSKLDAFSLDVVVKTWRDKERERERERYF